MSGLIWLASYPRSGNTWTRLLLYTLKEGRAPTLGDLDGFAGMAIHRRLLDTTLECDSGVMVEEEVEELRADLHAAMTQAEEQMIIKVHDAWRRTRSGRAVHAAQDTHAAIYIIRDPRDVAVSWAAFKGCSLDEAADYLAQDNVLNGDPRRVQILAPQHIDSWSVNASSWIDESGLAPLVVRYEDLLENPAPALRAVADHLGWEVTDETIQLAINATRFERLAKMESENGFAERPANVDRFFRSGRAQGWRGALTADQTARIERDHGAMMKRFGYL